MCGNEVYSSSPVSASGASAADAIIGTYAAHSAGDDVHIVALMQQAGGYGVGVSDANTDLKQAVSEALATLTGNGKPSFELNRYCIAYLCGGNRLSIPLLAYIFRTCRG